MLICLRCHTNKQGNSSYEVCEGCGGKFTVVRDRSFHKETNEPDEPQELNLGVK